MSQRIDISLDGLQKLHRRIEGKFLVENDWPVLNALVSNLLLREKGKVDRAIAKLAAEALGRSDDCEKAPPEVKPPLDDKPKGKGHGRNGSGAFTNAKHLFYKLALGIIGSICEACNKSKLKRYRDKEIIRVIGQPLFSAEIHTFEQARCIACGRVITATVPFGVQEGIGKAVTYHWSACAMLMVIHYTGGMPFKRLESLHKSWGIPFSDANQWEVMSQSVDFLLPLLKAIERYAIDKVLNLRIDDTGSMILELQHQINAEIQTAKNLGQPLDKIRTGINATCVHIETPNGKVILFFTGRHHAGEIINRILERRHVEDGKVIKVTDGASKNFAHQQTEKVIEATCNAHAFLKFHEIKAQFPAEYAIVGEAYHQVFENDAIIRDKKMTPEERLSYHENHSRSHMEKIREMCADKIQSRLVEPNSPLWQPVTFFLNQWSRLTRFLETPGIPLDTNLVEQDLIIPVRYLAASFNYQTVTGSEVGDSAMSLTATARANAVEPVAYIAHCLENHEDLAKNPEKYLPWVYRDRIKITHQSKPPDSKILESTLIN